MPTSILIVSQNTDQS